MKAFFKVADRIKPFYDFIDKVILIVCKLLLILVIGITAMAVTGRYVSFIPDPAWSEEMVLTFMAYMAVLSAALAIRRRTHIRMTAFDRLLPRKLRISLDIFADVAVMALGFIMIFVGWSYAQRLGSFGSYISIPTLSRFWKYFPIPVAGVAMVVFEIEAFLANLKKLVINEENPA